MFQVPVQRFTSTSEQCCGSGSTLDPYSGAFWIRIRIRNTDPDPNSMYLDPQHCFWEFGTGIPIENECNFFLTQRIMKWSRSKPKLNYCNEVASLLHCILKLFPQKYSKILYAVRRCHRNVGLHNTVVESRVAEKIFVCVFSRKLQTPHHFFVVNYIILLWKTSLARFWQKKVVQDFTKISRNFNGNFAKLFNKNLWFYFRQNSRNSK